jgi:hypothetical protein
MIDHLLPVERTPGDGGIVSRTLPARPNLEYLKKEAKGLLDDLRRSNPSAQLADAQFALSRDYGFDSWPKLKSHVESIAALDTPVIAGGWIANVAKSQRHPANPFRSARVHFTVNGDSVDIVDEFVDESGTAIRGRNHVDADGVERAGGNGYSLSAAWIANGLQTVAKKDGQVLGRTMYAVSADGRSLTIAGDSGEQIIVLDRAIDDAE